MIDIIHIPTGRIWNYAGNDKGNFKSIESAWDRFEYWKYLSCSETTENKFFIHFNFGNYFTFQTMDSSLQKIEVYKEEFDVIEYKEIND